LRCTMSCSLLTSFSIRNMRPVHEALIPSLIFFSVPLCQGFCDRLSTWSCPVLFFYFSLFLPRILRGVPRAPAVQVSNCLFFFEEDVLQVNMCSWHRVFSFLGLPALGTGAALFLLFMLRRCLGEKLTRLFPIFSSGRCDGGFSPPVSLDFFFREVFDVSYYPRFPASR